MPFIEQGDLWSKAESAFRANRVFSNQPPHVAAGVVLPVFVCPSDPRTLIPREWNGSKYGLCSYLGVAGYDANRRDGLFYQGSSLTLASATDGLSSTLLIGERPPSADMIYGWWYAGVGLNFDGDADAVLGVRARNRGKHAACSNDPPRFADGRIDNICDLYHYWSLHSGGANFAFADGSVRLLRYSADPIMPALASRAGGETIVGE